MTCCKTTGLSNLALSYQYDAAVNKRNACQEDSGWGISSRESINNIFWIVEEAQWEQCVPFTLHEDEFNLEQADRTVGGTINYVLYQKAL